MGLHYAVAAPRGAAYSLHGKFRAVRIRGKLDLDRRLGNHFDLRQGAAPARVAARGGIAKLYIP